MSNSEVWKYLHDGSIDGIDGSVPGDVAVHVSIPYLRKAFAPSGQGFVILLKDCSLLELQDEGEPACSDLQEIARRSPEILSIVSEDPLAIYCTMGTLSLAYGSDSLALDTGEAISVQDLDHASSSYWDSWSKSHGGSA
jgi:hypothetical protein